MKKNGRFRADLYGVCPHFFAKKSRGMEHPEFIDFWWEITLNFFCLYILAYIDINLSIYAIID
jgi:hypothetical protein